jgi:hypothetical protein
MLEKELGGQTDRKRMRSLLQFTNSHNQTIELHLLPISVQLSREAPLETMINSTSSPQQNNNAKSEPDEYPANAENRCSSEMQNANFDHATHHTFISSSGGASTSNFNDRPHFGAMTRSGYRPGSSHEPRFQQWRALHQMPRQMPPCKVITEVSGVHGRRVSADSSLEAARGSFPRSTVTRTVTRPYPGSSVMGSHFFEDLKLSY